MQSCLLGSWRAKSRDVDEEGFFNLASPENLKFKWFDFGHLLWQACLHLERREVHQGRRLIFNAASCLRVGLAVSLPHAISDVLFFIARLCRRKTEICERHDCSLWHPTGWSAPRRAFAILVSQRHRVRLPRKRHVARMGSVFQLH